MYLPPYPPFRDPDDWREAAPASERDRWRAQVECEDAAGDHVGKHDHHAHPFCHRCEERFRWSHLDSIDVPTTLVDHMPLDARVAAQEWVRNYPSPATMEEVPDCLGSVTYPFAVMSLIMWATMDGHLRFQRAMMAESLLSRAVRYLLKHGRYPDSDVDLGDTDLDSAYLDSDELDDLPSPEPMIAGVLNRHTYSLLSGRDTTFKSFVALDWALSVATGRPWLGRAVEQSPVLYIAGEGGYGIAQRVRAWEAAWRRQVEPGYFTVRTSAVNMFRPGAEFDDLLTRAGNYSLIIVDTLRRASGGAEGNGSDMGVVIDNLARLSRATDDGAVLVIAHTGKTDVDARGFSGIEDDADTVWKTSREDGASQFTLTNTKMKDGPDGETINLLAKPAHDSVIIESALGDPGALEDSRSEQVVMQAMSGPFAQTGASITDLIDVTSLSRATVFRARGRLVEKGRLALVGKGAQSRLTLPPQSHVK